MLVADLEGVTVAAYAADKGPIYRCPGCNELVTLKKGRIVIAHFAHKPPLTCSYAKGETREHMSAKLSFLSCFREQGLVADVEQVVLSTQGDRRADVLVSARPPSERKVALELQHQPIDLDQIERRTRAYVAAEIPVLWVPLLRPAIWDDAEAGDGDEDEGNYYVQRYTAPPWQRWLAGYAEERPVWFYEPERNVVWRAKLSPCSIYVPLTSYFESDGTEVESGGYSKTSRKWMRLDLWGPVPMSRVRLTTWTRKASRTQECAFPGGKVGAFIPAEPSEDEVPDGTKPTPLQATVDKADARDEQSPALLGSATDHEGPR